VFKYLGRYLGRGPISEKRVVGYDGKTVRIAYAHKHKHEKPERVNENETSQSIN
jgi:hypothetical protein